MTATADTATDTPAKRDTTFVHFRAVVADGDQRTPTAYLNRTEVSGLIAPWTYVVVRVDRDITLSMSPERATRLRDELARVLDAHRLSVEVSS